MAALSHQVGYCCTRARTACLLDCHLLFARLSASDLTDSVAPPPFARQLLRAEAARRQAEAEVRVRVTGAGASLAH